MKAFIDPCLTHSDTIVLKNLLSEAAHEVHDSLDDEKTIELLTALNDPKNDAFEPTIFASWDPKELPETLPDAHTPSTASADTGKANQVPADESGTPALHAGLQERLLRSYVSWASKVVRRPTDVVFLTHILIYLSTSVPSALYLYYRFSWIHGICHWVMTAWYCGAFTLLLHNHIHNNGVLSKDYAWFDQVFPYILEPLMGHTWDSYYYHHVKHHHVEANGPDDLSSTIRYQRDEFYDFSIYVGRFLLFVWLELPLYFLRKGKSSLAIRSTVSEFTSYGFIYLMAQYNFKPTLFVLIIPLVQMRIGMMVGNFGQHAFVDEVEPDSDFRSSITLIDVPVSLLAASSCPLKDAVFRVIANRISRVTATASTTAGTHPIISTLAATGVTTLSPS